MGEPIAGRISTEAKEHLEREAEERGVSISELTGSIVTLWLRENSVGAADDPDDATPDTFDKSLEEVYDELEAVRFVLESVSRNAKGSNLRGYLENQVFNEHRGFSEIEQPDYVSTEPSGPSFK
jgi:hypothetical protein